MRTRSFFDKNNQREPLFARNFFTLKIAAAIEKRLENVYYIICENFALLKKSLAVIRHRAKNFLLIL